MKTFIRKRWIVKGFYRFCRQTSSWVYQGEYRAGEVVWEFDNNTLTCRVDDRVDHTVPYTVIQGDLLAIDFSSLLPHFNRYIETYKIVKRGNEAWLYDRKTKTPQNIWLVLKLVPAE